MVTASDKAVRIRTDRLDDANEPLILLEFGDAVRVWIALRDAENLAVLLKAEVEKAREQRILRDSN